MGSLQGSGEARRYLCLALAATCLSIGIGIAGLDFGDHWDEPLHLDGVQESLATGTLLPKTFSYPSLTYDLCLVTALAYLVPAAGRADWVGNWLASREALRLHAARQQDEIRLATRGVFLVLAQLAAVALFFLTVPFTGYRVACLASVLLSTCNEYLYHSRWIAPDAIMASAATACLALLVAGCRSGSLRQLAVGAAFGGLAVGTKYTAACIVVPVLAAAIAHGRRHGRVEGLKAAVALLAILCGVFLLTTPGSLVMPERVIGGAWQQERVYGTLGQGMYTVPAGLDHAGRLLLYLATQAYSPSVAVNVCVFAMALVGCVVLLRRRDTASLLVALLGIPYFILLVSHRVMIVRNAMLLLPLLMMLAAIGVSAAARSLSGWRRGLLVLTVAAVIAVNAAGELKDALEIRRHAQDPDYAFALAVADLNGDAELSVYADREAGQALQRARLRLDRQVPSLDEADVVLTMATRLPSTLPHLIRKWYGTREVNFPYYTSWLQRKPALVSVADARRYDDARASVR